MWENNIDTKLLFFVSLTTILLAGCQAVVDVTPTTGNTQTAPATNETSNSGGSSTNPASGGDVNQPNPINQYAFGGTGKQVRMYGGKSVTLNTQNLTAPGVASPEKLIVTSLKVSVLVSDFVEGPADAFNEYRCMRFSIRVNHNTTDTKIMSVPNLQAQNCPDAPHSDMIDLTPFLNSQTELGQVSIALEKPMSDVSCNMYLTMTQGFSSSACPVAPLLTNFLFAGYYTLNHWIDAKVTLNGAGTLNF